MTGIIHHHHCFHHLHCSHHLQCSHHLRCLECYPEFKFCLFFHLSVEVCEPAVDPLGITCHTKSLLIRIQVGRSGSVLKTHCGTSMWSITTTEMFPIERPWTLPVFPWSTAEPLIHISLKSTTLHRQPDHLVILISVAFSTERVQVHFDI